MKEILEGLWNEYLWEKCAALDTDEERRLTEKALKLHKKANALLNKEQEAAVEKYIDALCNIEAILVKKAFFKGCEFAVSFLLAVGNLEK